MAGALSHTSQIVRIIPQQNTPSSHLLPPLPPHHLYSTLSPPLSPFLSHLSSYAIPHAQPRSELHRAHMKKQTLKHGKRRKREGRLEKKRTKQRLRESTEGEKACRFPLREGARGGRVGPRPRVLIGPHRRVIFIVGHTFTCQRGTRRVAHSITALLENLLPGSSAANGFAIDPPI